MVPLGLEIWRNEVFKAEIGQAGEADTIIDAQSVPEVQQNQLRLDTQNPELTYPRPAESDSAFQEDAELPAHRAQLEKNLSRIQTSLEPQAVPRILSLTHSPRLHFP